MVCIHFTNTYYLLTYLLDYSMELSPSWESNCFSTSQQIPHILWNPKFITVFTSSHHLSLCWASSIQSTSRRSILTLSFHLCLGLQNGLFLSDFPTKTLYTPFLSPPPIHATCLANLILLDWSPKYLVRGTDRKVPCYVVFSTLLLSGPS
jgi:hypothetical protein